MLRSSHILHCGLYTWALLPFATLLVFSTSQDVDEAAQESSEMMQSTSEGIGDGMTSVVEDPTEAAEPPADSDVDEVTPVVEAPTGVAELPSDGDVDEVTPAVEAPTQVVEPPLEVAEEEKSPEEMSRRVTASVGSTIAADVPLQELLASLEHAKSAGLGTSKVQTLENHVRQASRERLKKARAAAINPDNCMVLKEVFSLVERANLPKEEIAAAWSGVKADVQNMLRNASQVAPATANDTVSQESLTQLAHAIHVWRKLGFTLDEDETEISAKKAFKRMLDTIFAGYNVSLAGEALRLAEQGGGQYNVGVANWVRISETLRQIDEDPDSAPLRKLLDTIGPAEQFSLSETHQQHLERIRNASRNQTLQELHEIHDNHSLPSILERIANAKTSLNGSDESAVTTAVSRAQKLAKKQLEQAASSSITPDNVDEVKHAFVSAEEAGVPPSDVAVIKQELQSRMYSQMVNAMAKLDANQNESHLNELSDAYLVWYDLQVTFGLPSIHNDIKIEVENVITKQTEAAALKQDVPFVVEGSRTLNLIGMPCRLDACHWRQVSFTLENIARDVDQGQTPTMHSLQATLQMAEMYAFPATKLLRQAENFAILFAMENLDKAMNTSSLDVILPAWEDLQSVIPRNVSGDISVLLRNFSVESKTNKMQSLVTGHLNHVLATPTTRDSMQSVKTAFQYAQRAQVNASAAWAKLEMKHRTRLVEAMAAVNASTPKVSSGSMIEDLADAIYLWEKLQMPSDIEELGTAKELYSRQMVAGREAQNVNFTVLAVSLSDLVGVHVSPELRKWASVSSRMQQAVSTGRWDQDVDKLLELKSHAHSEGLLGTDVGRRFEKMVQQAVEVEVDGRFTKL